MDLLKNEQWQELEQGRSRASLVFYVLIACGLSIMLLIMASCSKEAFASTITEAQAVQCILGEARGEGFESLKAHASALRNRGHLKGVYGCKAKFDHEMQYLKAKGILKQAKEAWALSLKTDYVAGASFWGSTLVDKDWIKTMKRNGYILTKRVGNTEFYRKP